ncbi:MAG: hypothetical protein BWY42_01275 [Candidatus Omnitrophica bacterium ADurb.Bin277]|nr:MAG: hypothetical protein BWY42_01275 [Candidatus Omnitrophica bacterium ADurb.Bin277]
MIQYSHKGFTVRPIGSDVFDSQRSRQRGPRRSGGKSVCVFLQFVQQIEFGSLYDCVLRKLIRHTLRQFGIAGKKIQNVRIKFVSAAFHEHCLDPVIFIQIMKYLADFLLSFIMPVSGLDMNDAGTLSRADILDLSEILRKRELQT